jgi:predicted phosphodiesterase
VRVAALYDIHANLPALEAVLEEVTREDPNLIVIGGDVVFGPMNAETVDILMGLGERVLTVGGNSDREVGEAFDQRATPTDQDDFVERVTSWSAAQIDRSHRDFLATFAPTVELEIDGLGPTLFCHGSPRSDEEMITTLTPEERLADAVAEVRAPVIVCGHTHQQFDRRIGDRRIVNAGSVGLPYEGRPGAYWAILGPDVELRRTAYDLEAAIERMRGSGCPDLDEFLEESLVNPTEADAVARIFEERAREAERP